MAARYVRNSCTKFFGHNYHELMLSSQMFLPNRWFWVEIQLVEVTALLWRAVHEICQDFLECESSKLLPVSTAGLSNRVTTHWFPQLVKFRWIPFSYSCPSLIISLRAFYVSLLWVYGSGSNFWSKFLVISQFHQSLQSLVQDESDILIILSFRTYCCAQALSVFLSLNSAAVVRFCGSGLLEFLSSVHTEL